MTLHPVAWCVGRLGGKPTRGQVACFPCSTEVKLNITRARGVAAIEVMVRHEHEFLHTKTYQFPAEVGRLTITVLAMAVAPSLTPSPVSLPRHKLGD